MMEGVLTDRWKRSSTMRVLIKDHTGCPHVAFCFSWPQFGVQPVIPTERKELWAALCIEPDTHTQQHRLLSTPRKVSFHHHHFLRKIYSLIQLDMQQRHRNIYMDFYKNAATFLYQAELQHQHLEQWLGNTVLISANKHSKIQQCCLERSDINVCLQKPDMETLRRKNPACQWWRYHQDLLKKKCLKLMRLYIPLAFL